MVEERARNHEALFNGSANAVWDLVLYEAVAAEPNLTLLLNTSVRDVLMDPGEPGRIQAVDAVQLGNERAYRIEARLFLDATGDGTVGWRAGADAREGRESRAEFGEPLAPETPDDLLMGSTLLFRAREQGHPVPFTPRRRGRTTTQTSPGCWDAATATCGAGTGGSRSRPPSTPSTRTKPSEKS